MLISVEDYYNDIGPTRLQTKLEPRKSSRLAKIKVHIYTLQLQNYLILYWT